MELTGTDLGKFYKYFYNYVKKPSPILTTITRTRQLYGPTAYDHMKEHEPYQLYTEIKTHLIQEFVEKDPLSHHYERLLNCSQDRQEVKKYHSRFADIVADLEEEADCRLGQVDEVYSSRPLLRISPHKKLGPDA